MNYLLNSKPLTKMPKEQNIKKKAEVIGFIGKTLSDNGKNSNIPT